MSIIIIIIIIIIITIIIIIVIIIIVNIIFIYIIIIIFIDTPGGLCILSCAASLFTPQRLTAKLQFVCRPRACIQALYEQNVERQVNNQILAIGVHKNALYNSMIGHIQ